MVLSGVEVTAFNGICNRLQVIKKVYQLLARANRWLLLLLLPHFTSKIAACEFLSSSSLGSHWRRTYLVESGAFMGLIVTEYIFSSFLPLCSACCEKHVRLSWSPLLAFHTFFWLFGPRPVGDYTVLSHSCALWRKRVFVETLLVVSHLTDLSSVSIQKRKNPCSFCGVLVWCLLCSRHVQSTQKEQNDNHKVVAELVVSEEEDLVVRKVPLIWYCSKSQQYWRPTMRKLLTTSLQQISIKRPTLWLDHFARIQQMNGQLQVESLEKNPPLFDGSTSWFKYEELIEDWLDLTVIQERKRGPALKNRLVGIAEKYERTSQSRISEGRRWRQVFSGFVETPFHNWTAAIHAICLAP